MYIPWWFIISAILCILVYTILNFEEVILYVFYGNHKELTGFALDAKKILSQNPPLMATRSLTVIQVDENHKLHFDSYSWPFVSVCVNTDKTRTDHYYFTLRESLILINLIRKAQITKSNIDQQKALEDIIKVTKSLK